MEKNRKLNILSFFFGLMAVFFSGMFLTSHSNEEEWDLEDFVIVIPSTENLDVWTQENPLYEMEFFELPALSYFKNRSE